ncbi:MAG: class I SAM-dependent methyltransferase [Planctomycetota bacterium]|nr:class I SAM-dependent methyltransferase [Planctomycetota bacterium]
MSGQTKQDEYAASAPYYDYVDAYTAREDVGFYVEQARASGGPVLEIGCGTGRVLIPTAKAGLEIAGLDYSNAMLARCREKLAAESSGVRGRVALTQGDMRSFDLGRTFKLITIPFRPFQHLETVEDQLACLACVRKHLDEGGRFILDIFNPSIPAMADDSRLKAFGHEPEVAMPDGRRVSRWARIAERNYAMQYNDVELVYEVKHPDGRAEQIVFAFRMRYLFRYEAEHLLVRAGFEVEALYADYDKSAYGTKYPGELIFVAKKRS